METALVLTAFVVGLFVWCFVVVMLNGSTRCIVPPPVDVREVERKRRMERDAAKITANRRVELAVNDEAARP